MKAHIVIPLGASLIILSLVLADYWHRHHYTPDTDGCPHPDSFQIADGAREHTFYVVRTGHIDGTTIHLDCPRLIGPIPERE